MRVTCCFCGTPIPDDLKVCPKCYLNPTFNELVESMVGHRATEKGYDGGKGQLYQICRDLPHPLGEIIYKVIRYHNKKEPEDLVKIAAWARLVWEERIRSERDPSR